MSEKNYYNFEEEYDMQCDCKFEYKEEAMGHPQCKCPPNNCCDGVTFDQPIMDKGVILYMDEVFENKLVCSVPIPLTLDLPKDAVVIQRYAPINECGTGKDAICCTGITLTEDAVYTINDIKVRFTRTTLTCGNLEGKINDDVIDDDEADKIKDIYRVPLYNLPSLYKDLCKRPCKGSKSSAQFTFEDIKTYPILEICGIVTDCSRSYKFFITIDYPEETLPDISTYISELCIPSLEAFDKPYLELSGLLDASIIVKPKIIVDKASEPNKDKPKCLPELEFDTDTTLLITLVLQSKVLVPVQRLMMSKGLYIPDNLQNCCNIPNVYPSQVEDQCNNECY